MVGEAAEHPVVREGVVDDSQEFALQGDVDFSSSAAALDALVEILQVRAAAFGDKSALQQDSVCKCVAQLGDMSGALGFIGVACYTVGGGVLHFLAGHSVSG